MIKIRKGKNLIVSIILALVMCFLSIITLPINKVFADTQIVYTTALEDLSKNNAFNENDYPANANDYIIEVITIAESEDNELFVYTYQPAQYNNATSINIATELTVQNDIVKKDYDNYKLEYLN